MPNISRTGSGPGPHRRGQRHRSIPLPENIMVTRQIRAAELWLRSQGIRLHDGGLPCDCRITTPQVHRPDCPDWELVGPWKEHTYAPRDRS